MSKLVLRWIILAVSVVLSALLTNVFCKGFSVDVSSVGDFGKLLIGVAVLSLLNATLGRILKLVTIPLNCLTLGLVSLLINAAILEIAGSLGFGFKVDSFLAALVGSVLISVINGLLGSLVKDDESKD